MIPRVYLAGPITGLTYDESTTWRNEIAMRLPGIACFSPMRGKQYLADRVTMPNVSDEIMSTGKAIVTRDHFDSTHCDLLVANLLGATKVSIGTMIELGWADAHRIPILIVMEDNNIHQHAFLRELAGWIVSTIEEAADIMNIFFESQRYKFQF